MRAAGMSVNRVLFPVGLVCFAIAIGHFVFQELVAVKSIDRLAYWRANEFAIELPPSDKVRTKFRLNFDDQFISFDSAVRNDTQTKLQNVFIYERNEFLISKSITATEAIYENGNWMLHGVSEAISETQQIIEKPQMEWPIAFNPDFLFALSLNPDRTRLPELWQKIEQMRADSADTRSEMTSFFSRFSRPLGTLIMPLLGAIAGFGIHRQGVMLARAVNGSLLGFTYFIVENISLALGKLGVLPAMIGAFFPLTLFLVIGFTIVLAMESK